MSRLRDNLDLPANDFPMSNSPRTESPTLEATNITPPSPTDPPERVAEYFRWSHGQHEWTANTFDYLNKQIDELKKELRELRAEKGTKVREPNIADPQHFNGDRREIEHFLSACKTKFRGQPSKFPDEPSKILWASSFLRGAPATWFQPILEEYDDEDGIAPPKEFTSFKAFATSLRTLYGDSNLARNAAAALENLRQVTSVADYIAKFESHRQHTKHNDFGAMRLFYGGLKPHIKDELTSREYETLRELQSLAARLDSRIQERRVEQSHEQSRVPLQTHTRDKNKNASPPPPGAPPRPAPPARPPYPTQQKDPALPTDGTTPME